ncbi:MAG: hypothetical protein NTW25_15955 [Candidatus Kapabacteria bacterium]|nr:hypothetical protein [Candidatus Kapabacteria bacterium]
MNSYYYTDEEVNNILTRDGFKCVVCGNRENEILKLNIGFLENKTNVNLKSNLNKVTLCENHKNINEIHSLKKLFLDLHQISINENNSEFISFTNKILKVYEYESK